MNFRMLPPVAASQQSIVANGRTYSAVPGVVVDVPDFDAAVLSANGWVKVAASGPTSARPSPNPNVTPPYTAARGVHFYDTTISKLIVFDGAAWRSPVDGSAV